MPLFKRHGVSLSQFVRGIVKALTDGQQAIPHAREEHLECHMKRETGEDGQEVYKPKTVTVEISEGHRITVPTYTLAQVNTIGISSAKITCSARIVGMEMAEQSGEMNCGECHAVFNVHPSLGSKNSFEMVIEFEQREPSESESRLIESLDSMVVEPVGD